MTGHFLRLWRLPPFLVLLVCAIFGFLLSGLHQRQLTLGPLDCVDHQIQGKHPEEERACEDLHDAPDGGDCQALLGEVRRPNWACFSEMRAALPAFLDVYNQRPIRSNAGGIRLDHSFALYYTLQYARPRIETVIESGAYKGQSTWIIRQALPNARIISLDPANEPDQQLEGVEYMLGSDWVDVGQVDWGAKGVNPDTTLFFVDDHQSGYRRALLEMKPQGFYRFIFEDNYPYLRGDHMSFKWACELQGAAEWPGKVLDDIGRSTITMSWDYHLKQANYLHTIFEIYYEFPPVASTELSRQTRYDPKHTSSPIVTERQFFEESGLVGFDEDEFGEYTHICYVELRRNVKELPPAFAEAVTLS